MDAREALQKAHRAVELAIKPPDPDDENPLTTPAMRMAFARLLMQVANDDPDDLITRWSEARDTVPLCVDLVPKLQPKRAACISLLTSVVDHAEKLAPTYVTPPPYI